MQRWQDSVSTPCSGSGRARTRTQVLSLHFVLLKPGSYHAILFFAFCTSEGRAARAAEPTSTLPTTSTASHARMRHCVSKHPTLKGSPGVQVSHYKQNHFALKRERERTLRKPKRTPMEDGPCEVVFSIPQEEPLAGLKTLQVSVAGICCACGLKDKLEPKLPLFSATEHKPPAGPADQPWRGPLVFSCARQPPHPPPTPAPTALLSRDKCRRETQHGSSSDAQMHAGVTTSPTGLFLGRRGGGMCSRCLFYSKKLLSAIVWGWQLSLSE